MPKPRQTCTRCSQRRQKCDRKQPCTRCVRNKEPHLCTTIWAEGYNPSVHRRYPKKPSISARSTSSSKENSSGGSPPVSILVHDTNGASVESPASNLLDGAERFEIGNSRVIDISMNTLLNEKDAPHAGSTIFDESLKYVPTSGKLRTEPSRISNCFSPAAKAAEIQHLQSILPSKEGLLRITNYYSNNMLYWIGGMYHGPTFRKQLLEACGMSATLDVEKVDWRWMALLFAILSSGIISCPETLSTSWGYSMDKKVQLSRAWGTAAVTCLNLGNYTSQYHICSVQAIYILHGYEHLVGSTNQWVALRSVAIVIAKGLGIHRLGSHPDDLRVAQLNEEEKKAFIEREIGRRTWTTIVCQEWLCASSQNHYTVTLQKNTFTTSMPMILDEETMLPPSDATPTLALIGRYFHDYGSVLLEFHNAMETNAHADDTTRYAMVLKFDGELRATSAEKMPISLSPQTPLDPSWPKWVKWARTLHQVSVDHKVIMLHQTFLSKSFRDARYTYTRWACATSAKNIINIYSCKTRDPEEPQWWVEQAFVVTSTICLVLDMFNRPACDPEALEHHAYVQRAIRWLQQFFTSSVALHGVRLLYSLLQEYNKQKESSMPTRPMVNGGPNLSDVQSGTVPQLSQDYGIQMDTGMPQVSEESMPWNFEFDIDTIAFEDLMDYLPMDGVDSNPLFDSLFSLANGQQYV